jgi:hypothetical protein
MTGRDEEEKPTPDRREQGSEPAWARPVSHYRFGRRVRGRSSTWLEFRLKLPVGPLLCVINGPTCGGQWSRAAARADLRTTAEGVPLVVIQRQLGHSNLGITSVHLQSMDNAEIIDTVMPTARP